MSNRRLLPNIAIGLVLVSPSAAFAQSSTETYTYDALGRLIKVVTTGGANNNETQSICYDAVGNRMGYVANTSAGATVCSGSPTPNNPQVAVNASTSGVCLTSLAVNLTANDDDPKDNYPFTLTAIMQPAGSTSATNTSASSVNVTFGPAFDISTFDHTLQGSLGASSIGLLSALTSDCGGSYPPPEGGFPPPEGELPP